MEVAANAGTRSIRTVRLTLKKSSKIFLPLSDTAERTPLPGHMASSTKASEKR